MIALANAPDVQLNELFLDSALQLPTTAVAELRPPQLIPEAGRRERNAVQQTRYFTL